MNATKIAQIVETLSKAFEHFNKELCSESLKMPIITILSRGRKNGTLGWYSKARWKSLSDDKSSVDVVDEICICAETLTRTPEEVFETLIHEMAHLANWSVGIEDCNAAQYHNKHFKKKAEEFGLTVTKMKPRGYAHTALGERAKAVVDKFITDHNITSFGIERTVNPAGSYKKLHFVQVSKETKLLIQSLVDSGEYSSQREAADALITESIEDKSEA